MIHQQYTSSVTIEVLSTTLATARPANSLLHESTISPNFQPYVTEQGGKIEAPAKNSEVKKALRLENDQPPSKERLKSPCWQGVIRERSYQEVISSFRSIWLEALVQFCQINRLCEKYDEVKGEEFDERQDELPENLRLSLTDFTASLGRKELGLRHTYKPPFCWLSLRSNTFLLFFQSLFPYSSIDRQGKKGFICI